MPYVRVLKAGGVRIGIAPSRDDRSLPGLALDLIALLAARKLPRFIRARHGVGNCHFITQQFYLDVKDIGLAHLFAFKRGSADALRCEADPDGGHSWVESGGWALDASGGGLGDPAYPAWAESLRAMLRLTNVYDIDYEAKGPA
jgi:hypothetical protein